MLYIIGKARKNRKSESNQLFEEVSVIGSNYWSICDWIHVFTSLFAVLTYKPAFNKLDLGGGNWEDHGLRSTSGKNVSEA
jgi:hypothetical protein